jgi:nucleotide-binding universal stress UspA family protein
MYHRILVPLDGSERAEAVLPCVARLARGLQADIVLLSVIDPRSLYFYTPSRVTGSEVLRAARRSPIEERTRRYLAAIRDRYNLSADLEVRTGRTVETILEARRECGCDLITLSVQGTEESHEEPERETALAVLHHSEVPVLLFCPTCPGNSSLPPSVDEAPAAFGTLVVPVDGSPAAESVLPFVRDLALGLGIEVRLLYPISLQYGEPLVKGAYTEGDPIPILRSMEKEAEEYTRCLARHLERQGVHATGLVMRGSPAENIRAMAADSPGCTVVIASRSSSSIGRLLLNGATEKVVRRSRVPVLVVPASRTGTEAAPGS